MKTKENNWAYVLHMLHYFITEELIGKQGDRPFGEPVGVPNRNGLHSPAAPQPKHYKGK